MKSGSRIGRCSHIVVKLAMDRIQKLENVMVAFATIFPSGGGDKRPLSEKGRRLHILLVDDSLIWDEGRCCMGGNPNGYPNEVLELKEM
jgi:hypothetical protein